MSAQTSHILPYLLLPEQSTGMDFLITKIQKKEGVQSIKVITSDRLPQIYNKDKCILVDDTMYECSNLFSSKMTFIGKIKAAGTIYGYLVKEENIQSLFSEKGMIYLAGILLVCLVLFQYGTYSLIKKLSTKQIPANVAYLLKEKRGEPVWDWLQHKELSCFMAGRLKPGTIRLAIVSNLSLPSQPQIHTMISILLIFIKT